MNRTMNRIEEFKQNGKSFVVINFSGLATKEEFTRFVESAKPAIRKYPPNSLYTITNVEGVIISQAINEIIKEWTTHNKPYVKYGAVYGLDSLKKTVAGAIAVMSGRRNLKYFSTREESMSWLLKQD